MTNREILIENIKHYGHSIQHFVAMEELSELQKEISKHMRGIDVRNKITEELADVIIVCQELILMHDITKEELDKEISKKIKRQYKRVLKDRELYDR